MIITCRTCGKRYKMPAQPVDKLPVSVRCKACNTVIPVKETVAQAIATKGDVRRVCCSDCGKEYRITIRNLPAHVTFTACKACGGKVMLSQTPTEPDPVSRPTVSHLFSDPSLEDTPDFDMTSMLANGSLSGSGSTGAETLPLTESMGDVEAGDQVETVPTEVDFDKMIRLVKVLVVGALVILVVGMGFTRLRLYIDHKAALREQQKAELEGNIEHLRSSRRTQISEGSPTVTETTTQPTEDSSGTEAAESNDADIQTSAAAD